MTSVWMPRRLPSPEHLSDSGRDFAQDQLCEWLAQYSLAAADPHLHDRLGAAAGVVEFQSRIFARVPGGDLAGLETQLRQRTAALHIQNRMRPLYGKVPVLPLVEVTSRLLPKDLTITDQKTFPEVVAHRKNLAQR